MDDELSSVTLVGELDERPTFSETADGKLVASFRVRQGDNSAWCICSGPQAESAKRFGRAGVEVLIRGHLAWLRGDLDPHVRAVTLAFTNPDELTSLGLA